MTINPEDFGASFKGFIDSMAAQAPPPPEPFFFKKLKDHFNEIPSKLPVLTEKFEPHEHPNVHNAVETFVNEPGRSFTVCGIAKEFGYGSTSLSDLVATGNASAQYAATEGPVQYLNVNLEADRVLACVKQGLFFVEDGDHRLAILLCIEDEQYRGTIKLEVMATSRDYGERVLHDLRSRTRMKSVYRGHVLSISQDNRYGSIQMTFHKLPAITRDDIILPQGLLERIERHTIGFSLHSQQLLASGRHLKRGLLLHGSPGTGKTLTAMYLAGQMHNRTTLLLVGRAQALLESSCAMARALQPSTVILEDVDLVAEERTHAGRSCAPLLFELLNQMDGLSSDCDVLFLLTTNRPDILEPALSARPGRIDQAFEVPLPDEECRRRLFDLYGRGLKLKINNMDLLVERTQGASGAFIRELMRRGALLAAEEGAGNVVTDKNLEDAIYEMIVHGGELTKSLLGCRPPTSETTDT